MVANEALYREVAELKERLRREGFYEKPEGPVLRSWVYNIALVLGGLWGFAFLEPLWLRVPGILLSALGSLGISTLAHTASHGAASGRKWLNTFLFHLGFPFFLQVSARYWNHSHIQVHHPNPNVVGVDYDCDLQPFFALNEGELRGRGRLARLYYRWQGLLLPFVLVFNGFNVQRAGWRFLIGELLDSQKRTRAHWVDLAVLSLHAGVWILLPMFFFPPWKVLAVHGLRIGLLGYLMFATFAAAHFPAEAVYLEKSQRDRTDFYFRQAIASINFRTGFFGRLACNGVEFQIEHHIWPHISHVHYRRLSPLMKAFCERHGMPYRTLGWFEAVWKSYQVFFRPKPLQEDVERLRLSAPEV
jgi:linoleoyl-CoA desaturase